MAVCIEGGSMDQRICGDVNQRRLSGDVDQKSGEGMDKRRADGRVD